MSSLVQALSITTRGIGLGTCYLCYIAAMENIEPPIYEMYRVYLGLAEAKLRSYPYLLDDPERDQLHQYKVSLQMLERLRKMTIVPTPIKLIIDAITSMAHEGIAYTPVLAAQVRDAEGRLVPRPENLLLSNLREVVVALSSPETPAAYRAAFKANCPIPGVIWNYCDLVKNADEIIPQGYNFQKNLSDDMYPVNKFMTRLREKYPMMASGPLQPKVTFGVEVSKAALLTSRMGDLRAKPKYNLETLKQYCMRCHPLGGSMEEFYALGKREDIEGDRLVGQVALLGELPNEELLGELAGPVLNVHRERQRFYVDDFLVDGDYPASLFKIYEDLLFPANSCLQSAEDESAGTPRSGHRNRRGRGARMRQNNQ